MLVYLSILFRTYSAWFLYIFGLKRVNSKLYYSSIYLFSKQSFRLPQSAKKDVGIIFKTYFRTVKDIFKKRPVIHERLKGVSAAMDSSFAAEEARINYLKYYGETPSIFISREDISGALNTTGKIMNFALASKLLAFFWLGSFSKNRAAYALLIKESVEWSNLLRILKKYNVKKIFLFNIYEKDSNFMAYLLMRSGIFVSKITSEVPLTFANKIILTNELCLCTEYQKEEVKAFEKSVFFDSMKVWGPEMQITYIDLYKNKNFSIPVHSIGFYSSAFWLRKRKNHSIANVGSYDAEEIVLRYISDYVSEHPNIKLTIFTHPYEKTSEAIFSETLEYYKSVLKEDVFTRSEITEKGTVSTETFSKVNIGISLFSTVMFERIHLGFKTILAPVDKKDFPLENSPFRNICVYSKEELFDKLDKNLPLGKDQFFEMNRINEYYDKGVNLNYSLI